MPEKKIGCEYFIDPSRDRFCGKPAVMRYPVMGSGHMHLCEEHGAPHATYAERLTTPPSHGDDA